MKTGSKRAIWKQKHILFNLNFGYANSYLYMNKYVKQVALRGLGAFGSKKFTYNIYIMKKKIFKYVRVGCSIKKVPPIFVM